MSLVRVRNPWGDKNEWRGDWGDGDQHWDLVSEHTKKEMGLHYMYDGEFWIEFFTDFCREFEVRFQYVRPDLKSSNSSTSGSEHLYTWSGL